MVRRSPEPGAPLLVRKRDGRQVPFDLARLSRSLQAALAAAGRLEPSMAGDLGGVIETYLCDHAREPHGTGRASVTAQAIAELAEEVLRGAGCEAAALVYRATREERALARGRLRIRATAPHDPVRAIPEARSADPEAWSKGRVAALLSHATDLSPGAVDAIAAEVERSLLASGLSSVGAALLREWVDNELVLRGHPPRLGQHRFVGLAPHELRGILADGAAGLSAEGEVSRRLFTRYALAEVYPAEVRTAHEQGLLGLENLGAGGRLDSVVLAPWQLPALGEGAGPRERLRALGPLLRTLGQLGSREVLLDWDGPALASQALADLLLHLADAAPLQAGGARLVFCLRPGRAASAGAFLGALGSLRAGPLPRPSGLPAVRLPAGSLSPEVLAQAIDGEAVDDRIQFAAGVPRQGCVSASVAVNVARLALACGPRRVHEFLKALDDATDLALAALAAQDALMGDGNAPFLALRRATGLTQGQLPRRRRLALAGVGEAALVLLGDGPRGRANRTDLAAALGERLSARLAGRDPEVRLGLPARATSERFGRLDQAAFPEGRELLPLCAARDGYRYDGAHVLPPGADGAEAGLQAGRFGHSLGLDGEAPVPRCTGSTDQRLAFLSAYLTVVTTPVPDLNPCG
jgi:hypothetical protein